MDAFNPDKLCVNLFKGFDFTGGQIFHFPIGTDVAVITVLLYRAACDYNMKRHQLMNERYRIALSKNVAAIAVSKFVRRDLFWWQQIVETM